MQCLSIRQIVYMLKEPFYLFLNGRVLFIGTDDILRRTPKLVPRVQLRRSLRQPQPCHPLGPPHRGLRRVARVFVQQQRHMPAPIVPIDLSEERLIVSAFPFLPRQQQPPARPQVHHSEDDLPGVAAAQPDLGSLAALGPSCSQRREEQQVGFVLGQHHAAGRQGPDLPPDSPFFSRAPGRERGHSEAVSGRSPVAQAPGGRYAQRTTGPCPGTTPLGARGQSNSHPGSRVLGAKPPAACEGKPLRCPPNAVAALVGFRQPKPRVDRCAYRYLPSCRCSAASRGAGRRCQPPTAPERMPRGPGFDGRGEHPAFAQAGAPGGAAARMLTSADSWQFSGTTKSNDS